MEIREVTEDDYEQILAIRNREDVYSGHDYLPDFYKLLIKTPGYKGYVVVHDGKFIAFSFAACLDDGKTMVSRAARVSKEWEGKGVYKILDQFILEKYSKMPGIEFKAVTFSNENQNMMKQIDEGNIALILKKKAERYTSSLENIKQQIGDKKNVAFTSVTQIGLKEMERIFSSKSLCAQLFPDDRLVVDWVPYRLFKSNVPLILSGQCYIFGSSLESDNKNPTLSCGEIIDCDKFLLYQLDIYGEVNMDIMGHIYHHINALAATNNANVAIHTYLYENADNSYCKKAFAYFGFERFDYETPLYMLCAENKL